MVAISLYKGNLHKVPNVPHRWLCPTPNISLKDFRTLLRRRNRTLSRLSSSNPSPVRTRDSDSKIFSTDSIVAGGAILNNGNSNDFDGSGAELPPKEVLKEDKGRGEDEKVLEVGDSEKKSAEKTDALVGEENNEGGDKVEVPANPLVIEKTEAENRSSEIEKRKKEIEEKLEVLNEKKHGLVQVLKQILNAEEQLKRQNTAQGMPGRPPLPLHVDTTTDSGSVTKLNTPKMGSDVNSNGDLEGGDADDVSNHNTQSLHWPHTNSASPSSDTQQRKPSSSLAQPHPHRSHLGVVGSPSRFAPAGFGHSSVSVSATSFVASSPSPSPAASGGTSVFRDGRLPSPWN
ncbi:uncharacterized protein LOC127255291 [Andrographis paniculata]|uniref:uncharacterized protein LOC127255291 n=1 Tax=Andrographis paniculata TaxID=175694 RepID=UPI0021E86862|nr:uncharacterized protein LOC127255291 [Andrographis paniculata]XP_051136730.1 uncharacterized protein LOC127255291 [Andrographis paniculata]